MNIIKKILKWLLAIAFIFAGINHFLNTDFYMRIMPPYLPWHLFLVYLSGVIETALGIMLLFPKFSQIAAWGIILLLLAVFPANIYMAMNTELFADYKPIMIYLRLLIQFVLIAWAFWFTRKN
jgi:uncharacterized membrane protein